MIHPDTTLIASSMHSSGFPSSSISSNSASKHSRHGWELLQAVVSWARSANARRLILRGTRSNARAVQLYEKAGFAHTQEVAPLRTGSPLLVQTMRLEL